MLTFTKDNDETKMLFSSKVEGTDWYMILQVPTKEYTSSLNSLLYLIIIVTVVAIVILIILLTIFLESFFKRLGKVSLIVGEVAEGNLNSSLPESSDELGIISLSFNKMIDNLRNIILKIKNVSEVVWESSESYKNVSIEVVSCEKDIKQAIENINEGAKNTSEEIQNITIAVDDMESKSKELVDISSNIDTMISETNDKTLNGSKKLNDTVELLHKMKESVNLSSNVIEELSEKSKTIEDITVAISNISEQTNLLALNASIEAARAGEQGKGFAVVAEEVSKLAEESTNSTEQIKAEINQIQDQVANAVISMKNSIEYVGLSANSIDGILAVFNEIEDEIKRIKAMSLNISEIAKVLLNENTKINSAVLNTSAISEETVVSVTSFEVILKRQEVIFTNLKGASEHLDELSKSLIGEISKFKIG